MPVSPIIDATKELNAVLVFADGRCFFGKGIGAFGKVFGELCFNTALSGYQEILTDPSYTGQIITFTMPHIGNVGVNKDDNESMQKYANGLVVREEISSDANFRSENNFNYWLEKNNITGISSVDTREITLLLRENGAKNAMIFYAKEGEQINIKQLAEQVKKIPSLEGVELSSQISVTENSKWQNLSYKYLAPTKSFKNIFNVVVVDYGVKNNILNCLLINGCNLTIVNCRTCAEDILKLNPDGVFLSNGPADPEANSQYSTKIIQKLLASNIPIFGICMGHQLLALALGLKTVKMAQGHRGANHPVQNLVTKKVEITSQNHGFCVLDENLPDNVEITHKSLFDNSIEGIKLTNKPVFSVQYHPESSPGPSDSRYLFKEFIELMKKNAKKN